MAKSISQRLVCEPDWLSASCGQTTPLDEGLILHTADRLAQRTDPTAPWGSLVCTSTASMKVQQPTMRLARAALHCIGTCNSEHELATITLFRTYCAVSHNAGINCLGADGA